MIAYSYLAVSLISLNIISGLHLSFPKTICPVKMIVLNTLKSLFEF